MNRTGEKVPCQHCGVPTPYVGSRCCDPCYALSGIVRDRPEVTRKMLAMQDTLRGLPTAEALLLEGLRLAEGLRAAVQMMADTPAGADRPLLERVDKFLGAARARYGIK